MKMALFQVKVDELKVTLTLTARREPSSGSPSWTSSTSHHRTTASRWTAHTTTENLQKIKKNEVLESRSLTVL